MKKIVFAVGDIPQGSLVLVRGMRAELADAAVANARALPRPKWVWDKSIRDGQSFAVEMLEGLGERSLQALADGPINDPSLIYLPAGRLSMAETRAREAAQILDASA